MYSDLSPLEIYADKVEKERARKRKYNADHPDIIKKAFDKWAEANLELIKERRKGYGKKWRTLRRIEKLALAQKRRAQQAGNGGSYTAQEWLDLCTKYGNKCLACGRCDRPLTADHVVPISKSGTSNIENIQPLCKSCNSSKGTKSIDYRDDN